MRTILLLLLTLFLADSALAQVHVRGYFRKDGTYVRPHYRSNPDGNFYNNWSTKGNVNPYTGEPGTKVTPPPGYGSVRRYYGQRRASAPQYDYTTSSPVSARTWSPPSGIEQLPALPEEIAVEDVQRSNAYCRWLYSRDAASVERCQIQQHQVLASVVLPDYSDLPENDVSRSARYCEWLYSDNRASFYDCFNTQIFGQSGREADFGSIPQQEVSRAKSYCEWVYGDNRGSYYDCLENQASELRGRWPVAVHDLPAAEWKRALRYCEWLYGDNRGSAVSCQSDQARSLRARTRRGTMERSYSLEAKRYCEWLYGDNRSSYWDCVVSR
jgi:hypothetical protein